MGIFTIIERPALHPVKIFLRELLYYSAMVFLFTLLLLHILVPCVENALASLPDTSFVVKQLKGLLDRLWRSMEAHRMQHDSGEEKNEIQ